MAIDVVEIENELERIRERLAGAPRLEMSALYAAQQALSWVIDPKAAASPLEAIADSAEDSASYSARNRPPQSSDTSGHYCA